MTVTARTACIATVHLLIDAKGPSEASDIISTLLTERGIYEFGSGLIDWSYRSHGNHYRHPRPVRIPDAYDRDAADLTALANPKGGAR
jgi:hypothetical protein